MHALIGSEVPMTGIAQPDPFEVTERKPLVDPQTLEQAQAGDQEAFASVFLSYAPYIAKSLASRGNRDVEDLLQETYIKGVKGITSFTTTPTGSIGSWLHRIAINTAIDRAKSASARSFPTDHQTDPLLTELLDTTDIEQEVVENVTHTEALRTIMDNVVLYDQEYIRGDISLVDLVQKVFVEGRSYAEYADSIGTSSYAVRQRVHRLRKFLQPLREQGIVEL